MASTNMFLSSFDRRTITVLMAVLVLSTASLSSQEKDPAKNIIRQSQENLPGGRNEARSGDGIVDQPLMYSPNAASLGTWGKIPADLYHGLANVTIPLDSLVGKGYTLPVYLTYNTMGNRPEIHPGWVGQNWTLHAGGCINRIVNGLPDEMSKLEYKEYYKIETDTNPGYLYHCNAVQAGEWDTISCLDDYLEDPNLDIGPDEFQVCIDDINASFRIKGYDVSTGECRIAISSKDDGTFKARISVTPTNDRTARTLYEWPVISSHSQRAYIYSHIDEFVITKDNGVEYHFGGTDTSKEFSYYRPWKALPSSVLNVMTVLNTWYLTKIVMPNCEEIDFSYEHDGIPIVKSDIDYTYMYREVGPGANPNSQNTFDTRENSQRYYFRGINFAFLQPCYLERIHSRLTDRELVFSRSRSQELQYNISYLEFSRRAVAMSGGYPDFACYMDNSFFMQLDTIGDGHHSIVLEHSASDSLRLKLNSIRFLTDDQSVERMYSMQYNYTDTLPPYNSKKTDAWGYYNGKYYGDIPYLQLDSYRTVNSTLIKAEMLTRLTYPTGGWTDFAYEPNEYSAIADPYDNTYLTHVPNGLGGGLRIASLSDNDGCGHAGTRTFSYMKDYGALSSGTISGLPKFVVTDTVVDTLNKKYVYSIGDENKINQIPTDDGSYVTYNRVTETTARGDRIVSEYYSRIAVHDARPLAKANFNSYLLANPVTSKALSRGLLGRVSYYTPEGSLVKKIECSYNEDDSRYIWSPVRQLICDRTLHRVSAVKFYCYQPYLKTRTVTEYPADGGAPHVTSETFDYDEGLRMMRSASRTVGSETEVTTFRYTGDITAGAYPEMRAAGFTALPVETRTVKGGKLTGATLTTYMRNPANGDYVPSAAYTASLATAVEPSSVPEYNGGIATVSSLYGAPDVEYPRYDGWSNPISVKGREIPDRALWWDAGRNHPSAVFEGVTRGTEVTAYTDSPARVDTVLLRGVSPLMERSFVNCEPGTVSFSVTAQEGYAIAMTISVDGQSCSIASVHAEDTTGTHLHESMWQHPDHGSISVAPGSHTIRVTGSVYDTPQGDPVYSGAFSCSWPQQHASTAVEEVREAAYDGAEHTGTCAVTLSPSDLPRNLDYRVYRGGRWRFVHRTFTGSGTTVNEGTDPVKDIRAYPATALASSYEYDGRGLLTGAADPRGVTANYGYDSYGRLAEVRDNSGNRVSGYIYSYATAIPANPRNSVTRRTYTSADGGTWNDAVTVFDGLGREARQISVAASPQDGKDIVSTTSYDANGRPVYSSLPVAIANAASATDQQIRAAGQSFYNDTRIGTTMSYDAYPFATEESEEGPGQAWHEAGRRTTTEFRTNSASPASPLYCMRLEAAAIGDTLVRVRKTSPWPAGALRVSAGHAGARLLLRVRQIRAVHGEAHPRRGLAALFIRRPRRADLLAGRGAEERGQGVLQLRGQPAQALRHGHDDQRHPARRQPGKRDRNA